MPQIIFILRLIMGGVFIYASLAKIADPETFARSIANYKVLPFGLENLMAIIMPWLELIAGICLITGFMLDGAALLIAGMASMFIIAIAQAMIRGYNIECGCGLNPGQMVGFGKLIEDVIYVIWAIMILKRDEKHLEFSKSV